MEVIQLLFGIFELKILDQLSSLSKYTCKVSYIGKEKIIKKV